MITIFANINQTDNPYYISVDTALERIRSGKSRDAVDAVRGAGSKEERQQLKKQLPSVCFGGKFERRAADALVQASGFMVLDFDGFETEESLGIKRFELEMDDYTYACWTSPSGDGLKVLVKIPEADKSSYPLYFKAIQRYYDCEYFDTSCKDISRVTYESYDPAVFINKDSTTWTNMYQEPKPEPRRVEITTDDPNKIISGILKWWNKNYGLVSGQRNNNMFVLASSFNVYGVSHQDALSKCLEFEQPDFTAQEITTAVNSAYRNTQDYGTKVWEDLDAVKKVEELVKKSVPTETILQIVPNATVDVVEKKRNVDSVEFWHIDKKGSVEFVNHKYREFLVANGFAKYYAATDGTFSLVQRTGCVIKEVMDEHIKDFVIEYLYNLSDKRIFDEYSGSMKIQKDDFLSFLPNVTSKFIRDDKNRSYVFYRNCIVCVTIDGIHTIDYDKMDLFIWEKQILDRDFTLTDWSGSEFAKFIRNISNDDEQRELTMRSTLGYMMHGYNNRGENPVVILNDETISDKPEGGTGKGIYVNAITKIRNSVLVDGKRLDVKSRFAFQRVTADTQVLCLQDVVKNFDFEVLFSMITDGMTIDMLYKGQLYIPFERSPKWIITTNYAIRGDGNSNERRKWEVEFTKYYSKNFTPLTEFGHVLFDDWSDEEWAKFDNYMISNIQLYLHKGLIGSDFKNLKTRQFYIATSHEFAEYCLGNDKKYELSAGCEYLGQEILDDFKQKYPDYGDVRSKLSHRTFYRWLDEYCKYKYGTKLLEWRSGDGKKIKFPLPKQLELL